MRLGAVGLCLGLLQLLQVHLALDVLLESACAVEGLATELAALGSLGLLGRLLLHLELCGLRAGEWVSGWVGV